jgi:hypothetical protein
MFFPLDPESRPKSTWQIGQATQGLEEERRTGRARWETEAEGCIDGTGVNRRLAEWRRRGRWRRRRGVEGSVGAEKSRRRIERTGDERERDGGRRGGMRGGGRRQRMEAGVEGDRRV